MKRRCVYCGRPFKQQGRAGRVCLFCRDVAAAEREAENELDALLRAHYDPVESCIQ